MLKALELIGFKSFADKTRFEFPPGVTCVVGPNGSGKSNVVDAIKWVLGEQSVKSLRGKEMADVIFNGSASRPPQNTAEVTLTFDNAKRALAVDTPEVHISRRVYRSGESEYLINRQPCRLRDIREMFFGTGVGSEHYSVIEQGKVDSMLQASARDRRMIFEEAAGISRFKTKKIESQRRLERVEQNLLRLSDIVSEVESRLRSVRMQASKARRYKEHVDRLQSLRTFVAMVDWRTLSERLTAAETHLGVVTQQRDSTSTEAESLDAQVLQIETSLSGQSDAIRQLEARGSQTREWIVAAESAIEHEQQRYHDLEDELGRQRQQSAALDLRAGDVRQQLAETASAVSDANVERSKVAEQLAASERRLIEFTSQLDTLRRQENYCRSAHVESMRQAAALTEEIRSHSSRIESATTTRERSTIRLTELESTRSELEQQLLVARGEERLLAVDAETRQAEWSGAQSRLSYLRQHLTQRSADLAEQRQRHAVASERAGLLAELEDRLEGITAGVKEVLFKARDERGPFRHVRGLVADLIRVAVDTAPLIDIALGDRTQLVVVDPDDELMSVLVDQPYPFQGRVGFVRLSTLPNEEVSLVELTGQPGVIARADRAVETSSDFGALTYHLLGHTWIVERLSDAIRLAREFSSELSFVTLNGEFLAADGTLTVGPRQTATGLVSRRSELRALRQLIDDLETSIAESLALCEHLTEQVKLTEVQVETMGQDHAAAMNRLSQHRVQLQSLEVRFGQIDDQRTALEIEIKTTAEQQANSESQRETARQRLEDSEAQIRSAEEQMAAIAERLTTIVLTRQEAEQVATAAKVELAKSDARLSALRGRQQQIERDQIERQKALEDHRQRMVHAEQRLRASYLAVLDRESQLATWYLTKESLSAEIVRRSSHFEEQREQRTSLAARVQQIRTSARRLDDQLRTLELQVHEVRLERQTLSERMRDDYGVELHELTGAENESESRERTEVEQEIAELRRKIHHLGNVNLDALDELDDLESRFASLSAQHQDLTKAKGVLEQIINKINVDSRRLFVETLEIVRTNFQALFRKLFGGGQADIVLEENVDVLESGIEIIARPPGKEPRNISLLSGGEKTMTCVALLLAIFQYRPSPFCVLDEVDAALDEANIERFIAVLREFLAWTQFIVVTHSKKTMTCATTLYGVTMQESGISKRVAVRFEDVHEDGRIMAPAGGDPGDDETQAA